MKAINPRGAGTESPRAGVGMPLGTVPLSDSSTGSGVSPTILPDPTHRFCYRADFEFAEKLEELNEELETLNGEARELEERIAENVVALLER